MPEIEYIPRRFSASSLETIDKANRLCRAYAAQRLTPTLRQLFYAFVSRGWLPNKQTAYDALGSTLNDARLAGMLNWHFMIDRTRRLQEQQTWSSPADILSQDAEIYKRDLWADQETHLEVWIEKDALVGTIERICNQHRVGFYPCRGYSSQSETWAAGQRFVKQTDAGKERLVILYLGDHDPSGIDMTRDVRDRMNLFVQHERPEREVEVIRLALNMDQIEQYKPPSNPTKMSDGRARGYIEQFGYECWELDALDPPVISALVGDAIMPFIDRERWALAEEIEAGERRMLEDLSENWTDVAAWLERES